MNKCMKKKMKNLYTIRDNNCCKPSVSFNTHRVEQNVLFTECCDPQLLPTN